MPQIMPSVQAANDLSNMTPEQALGPASIDVLKSIGATPEGAVGDSGQAIIQAMMAKSAEKALKNKFDTHADELLTQHPDGANILATVLAVHQAMNPEGGTDVTQQASGTPIQQQAQQIITPEHRTLIGNVLNTLGNITGINAMNAITEQGTKSMKLANLDTAQKILGQEPIQPEKIASMDRETYGKTLTGYTEGLGKNIDELKNLKDQFTQLDITRNPIDRAMSRPSKEQLSLLDQMHAISDQVVGYKNGLRTVLKNAPKSLAKSGNFKVTQIGK